MHIGGSDFFWGEGSLGNAGESPYASVVRILHVLSRYFGAVLSYTFFTFTETLML